MKNQDTNGNWIIDDNPVDISQYSNEDIERIFEERFGKDEAVKQMERDIE